MSRSPRIRFAGPSGASATRRRRTIGLGVIGLGTVGSGTVRVLVEHQHEIERRLGCRLELKYVCARGIFKRKDLSWLNRNVKKTRDWREVLRDPTVDIAVELVGEPATALTIARAALDAGKHLVTANKQLVAEHGRELAERSERSRTNLGIEACVAGGTPVLHAIREGLAGEHFTGLFGILNGTTNYILTEMEHRGCSFGEALAEAQAHGYAEPDPTLDIEGHDARYKIAILAMLCFGRAVRVRDIPAEGIKRIEQVDFAYAHKLQHTIRLIAGAERRGDRLRVFVRPMMIPMDSPLAGVHGATNGVLLAGNHGGNTMITGRGAGGGPTGVAVLSDVVEIARTITAGGSSTSPLGYVHWRPGKIAPPSDHVVGMYLRLVVRDRPGILARVCAVLARHGINIDSVLQEPGHSKSRLPFVMTLEPRREDRVERAVAEIRRLPFLAARPLTMPFARPSTR
jgi:homoserine dehydrogenase